VKIRRTRITIETNQVTVVHRRRITSFWCCECQDQAEFVPMEDINRLIEGRAAAGLPVAGQGLHFRKAIDGSVVVCVRSLSGSV
jgi:hypothetical protein